METVHLQRIAVTFLIFTSFFQLPHAQRQHIVCEFRPQEPRAFAGSAKGRFHDQTVLHISETRWGYVVFIPRCSRSMNILQIDAGSAKDAGDSERTLVWEVLCSRPPKQSLGEESPVHPLWLIYLVPIRTSCTSTYSLWLTSQSVSEDEVHEVQNAHSVV